MLQSIPVFVTNAESFNWTSFLWGGAAGSLLGALIILSTERLLDYFLSRRKFKKEKEQITRALHIEIENSLLICETVATSLTPPMHYSIFTFAKFKTIWTEKYCSLYIDYSDEDSLRLYSFLNGARILMEKFDVTQALQHGLHTSSRALSNFSELAYGNNQTMLKTAEELKSVLVAIKDLQKEHRIFRNDVDRYPGVQIDPDPHASQFPSN